MTTAQRKTQRAATRATPYRRPEPAPSKPAILPRDGPPSDDFEGMVAALQERFRRKTREQAARAEAAVRRAVEDAVGDVRDRVRAHDEVVEGQMGRLRDALGQMQVEREEQVGAFREAYHGMRAAVRAIMAHIAEQDRQLDAIIASLQSDE